jgi:Tol biopolymer transport system component
MGEVYRASDDRLGRDVALKVLKASLADDHDRLRRFEQEARAAAALNHPNIVAIYDIGMHDGAPYIVSELLEGQTLRQRLFEGPLTPRQAADYGIQIVQGLIAAHEKHIVHRDLKPENLFITREGRIKILDFGIAKLTLPEGNQNHSVATMTTQTKAGSVLGTVAYMSPEQLRGKPVDHRSDIFSVGAILYEMLTGKRAFRGETEVDTITAVLREEPPQMTLIRQSIPPAFERIVCHCLEKEPENRFQSARDLAFALSTVSDASTSRQIVAFRWGKIRLHRALPWVLSALLAIAAGVFLGVLLKPVASPAYHRLTFERGTVYSARFAAAGQDIVYGASWNGRAIHVYSTPADSAVAHPLELGSAHVLAISRNNELALALNGSHGSRLEFVNATLARAPLAGGTPREILQDVAWADWSPAGELAVVHHLDGRDRLEFPIGTVLYETTGWISHLRFSPREDKIAFMDHPGLYDDRGVVCIIDFAGQKATLSDGWESESGLAWSADGNEVWFTAAERGYNRALWAVSLSGRQRKVLSVPGGFTLQDIAPDGRVLATMDSERLAMEWTGKGNKVQDLSWYDWSVAKDISRDGQWVLFEESGEPTGPNYAVAIRKLDGSPPIRLGEGSAGGLSPDGKWAAVVFTGTPQRLTLLPVGPGQPRQVPLPGLQHLQNGGAHFLADGKRIVVEGNQTGRPGRSFVVDLTTAELRPVTPEGVYAGFPSPDGEFLAGRAGPDHKLTLFPVDGGDPLPIAALDPSYSAAQWSADSKALYVYRSGEIPLKVFRFEIATGKLTEIRELMPADRPGVVSIAPVVTNLDASEFAYSYYQALSVLYVVSGLK